MDETTTTIKAKTVRCDGCTQEFTIDVRADVGEDGGEVMYFVCPHCERRYDVARVSAEGVRLRRQMAVVQKAGGKVDHLRKRYLAQVSKPRAIPVG